MSESCRNPALHALVVEDEKQIADAVAQGLQSANICSDLCDTGGEAIRRASGEHYDFLLLDMGLPDMDGAEVLQRLRASDAGLPIIALTARGGLADRVGGLQQGADDYVTKPFFMEELLARIEAVLRRRGGAAPKQLTLGCLRMDSDARLLFVGTNKVRLTEREYELMCLLMRTPQHVFTQDEILERIWEHVPSSANNVVPVYVSRLRSKIADAGVPDAIHTIRGVGYCMAPGLEN